MSPSPCRTIREVAREEPLMRRRIASLLAEGPKTVPEIATAIDRPAREVMVWLMAMWRYGLVQELPKARTDAYFQYARTR